MPKQRKPPVHPRLDNDTHEQFARCIAVGNHPLVCYIGVGNNRDENAAMELARSKTMRLRAEEIFRQLRPHQYIQYGYKHVTDKIDARTW